MKPDYRPRIEVPKGYKMPKMPLLPGKPPSSSQEQQLYLNKVVDLLDQEGKKIFRGTRRDCLKVVKQRDEDRTAEALRKIYGW